MQDVEASLELYRWSTQDPNAQAAALAEIFRRIRPGQEPQLLREDFAGNAADSVAWIAGGRQRRAIAVDMNAPTLEHAKRRADRLLGKRAERLHFVLADVHQIAPPQVAAADVLSVLNFSSFYLHTRRDLLRYFRHAHSTLSKRGILVLNAFGGPAAMRAHVDHHRIHPERERGQIRALPAFDYYWEQLGYDACTSRIHCRIHFDVNDVEQMNGKRRIANAFEYDWRLWTLPELTEAMREAGFRKAQVWRHTASGPPDRPKVFLGPVRKLSDQELWVAYVVGIR